MAAVPVPDAAHLLGLRASTIWRRIRNGELPAHRDPESGAWLVDLDDASLQSAEDGEPTIEALIQRVADLTQEVDLLTQELRAHEQESAQLTGLRTALQDAVSRVRDLHAETAPYAASAAAGPPMAAEQPAAEEPAPAVADDPDLPQPGSGFVDAGIRLHYIERGSTDAPPVIFLHGLTGNAHNFDALAEHLARDFHCYALDLRGHGDSAGATARDYRVSTQVRDLDEFVQAIGQPDVCLIGTAFGADIALAYAGARPERVVRLIINDSGPDLVQEGVDRVRRYIRESPLSFKDIDAAVDWWVQNYPVLRDYSPEIVRDFVGYSVRPSSDGLLLWKFDPVLRTLDPLALRDVDLYASAVEVRCPTLVVRGAESDILSDFVAQRLRDTLASAELIEVPAVGHAPSLVEPEVLDAVDDFLRLPVAG